MKIEVYIPINNEARLMPYTMRHYSQFADVIILDNYSTDNSVEIAKSMGAEIRDSGMPDELNDYELAKLKSNCWYASKADWVIIADADEFIYHPDLVRYLESLPKDIAAIKPRFINMVSDVFPTTKGQIYEEVIMGSEKSAAMWWRKTNIFRPQCLLNINYGIGAHSCDPVFWTGMASKILDETEILTLHFRLLSIEYLVEKDKWRKIRVGEYNKSIWDRDYLIQDSVESMTYFFNEAKKSLIKVI